MFSTDGVAKTYLDEHRDSYPLVLYIKDEYDTKRDIIFGYSEVESMLFVLERQLHEFFIPQVLAIFDDSNIHHRLASATNYYVLEPVLASFNVKYALVDTYIFISKSTTKGLVCVAAFFKAHFDNEEENWPQAVQNLEKSVHASRLPLSLPRTRGQMVVHGIINSQDVRESLKSYYSIAFRWIINLIHDF